MNKNKIIEKIFEAQDSNGCWKLLPKNHKNYPDCLHYSPNFKSTLWVLILLADLKIDNNEPRVKKSLEVIKSHFFDSEENIYTIGNDHFPIPCLNGNMLYLDSYFNNFNDEKSYAILDFFNANQRFDDGEYIEEKNKYSSNKSCYGNHSCYWGVIKLAKGISFIPVKKRNKNIINLLKKCIDFILLHKVCYSSHKKNRVMIKDIDRLTFPNMYKSDFLEILWILKREKIVNENLIPSIDLLVSKKETSGNWKLEKKVSNLIFPVGEIGVENLFISERANEVLSYYRGILF